MRQLSEHAATHHRYYLILIVAATLVLAAAAVVPTLKPSWLPFLPPLTIDTDPENMLSADEPVRLDNDRLKQQFGISDFVVVGVVNDSNENGVFNPRDLANIKALTETAQGLSFDVVIDGERRSERVVSGDIIAPSTVDNIETKVPGSVSFSYLMREAPKSQEAALQVRDRALNIPLYRGTLVSEDGSALALYYPISNKKISYAVAQKLREKIDTFADTGAAYHITGLPVAEDRFGAEMFFQMAMSAPLAMLFVFLLLFAFFRNVRLILFSLALAMIPVIMTMSLLVVSGYTVHIMSSMIPIFIIPIAILDDIHILSDFHDRYKPGADRFKVISGVMRELWRPMLYTSLTTSAGFASLMLTPNPPVQVFGAFIAIGVLIAWFVTVTMWPAYLMVVSEDTLKRFGATGRKDDETDRFSRSLKSVGGFAGRRAKLVLAATVVVLVWAGVGISKIEVNDNPIRWFESGHEIRVADRIINDRFAGSYMAYLSLRPAEPVTAGKQPFKQPETLRYLDAMGQHLEREFPMIGKVASLSDIVKTVHRELLNQEAEYRIPDSAPAVAQTLLTYENSHNPDDIWNFVTIDYDQANMWFQLNSGDNKDMSAVVTAARDYMSENPPPIQLQATWFGLTYINLVWQEKMVIGMLEALLGSFVVVALLTSLLFRSLSWGLLAMVPLSVTVATIYGIIGWVGKPYDMPTAVLSSLSLGLAVDYAIHFLARSRQIFAREGTWERTLPLVFAEPARAITRNIVVLGVGFLPLLAASLVPYKTVGILISGILLLAGAATLLILPAFVTSLRNHLFKKEMHDETPDSSGARAAADAHGGGGAERH